MYNKTNWINSTTLITPDRLNNLEKQYDEAATLLEGIVRTNNTEIIVEVVADKDSETATASRLIYCQTNDKFYFGDGANWNELGVYE